MVKDIHNLCDWNYNLENKHINNENQIYVDCMVLIMVNKHFKSNSIL